MATALHNNLFDVLGRHGGYDLFVLQVTAPQQPSPTVPSPPLTVSPRCPFLFVLQHGPRLDKTTGKLVPGFEPGAFDVLRPSRGSANAYGTPNRMLLRTSTLAGAVRCAHKETNAPPRLLLLLDLVLTCDIRLVRRYEHNDTVFRNYFYGDPKAHGTAGADARKQIAAMLIEQVHAISLYLPHATSRMHMQLGLTPPPNLCNSTFSTSATSGSTRSRPRRASVTRTRCACAPTRCRSSPSRRCTRSTLATRRSRRARAIRCMARAPALL